MYFSHLCLGLPNNLFPEGLPVKILKASRSSSILAKCPSRFNHPDYSKTVQIMKFFIVKPSPLLILITLGSKFSPEDPVSKYP